MPDATERWTERTWSEQVAGTTRTYSGLVAFDVINAASSADALSKVPFTIGSSHDEHGDKAVCVGRYPDKKGFQYWIVRCLFSSESGGGDLSILPPDMQWGITLRSETVDRDAQGNPIVNSAGDPPRNLPQNDFKFITLYWETWEPGYNFRKALDFVDTVNEDQFKIASGTSFNGSGWGADGLLVYPGECHCANYTPIGKQRVDQTPLRVLYEFQFGKRIKVGENDYISPWDWRDKDEGTRGWTSADNAGGKSRGGFYNSRGEEMVEPVPLNGLGVPIDPDIVVGIDGGNPQPQEKPKGCKVDNLHKDDAVYLCWQKKLAQKFKGFIPEFK